MRFSDFLDEAPPPGPAPPAQPTPVAPARQHVLGPPPRPGDVSAFAELFGAVAPDTTAVTVVDALVVPTEISATVQALEGPLAGDIANDDPMESPTNDVAFDDDLLPQRGSRLSTIQETRAWSRGRSKR